MLADGLTHLAAALGTPTVALFTATDPRLAGVAVERDARQRRGDDLSVRGAERRAVQHGVEEHPRGAGRRRVEERARLRRPGPAAVSYTPLTLPTIYSE